MHLIIKKVNLEKIKNYLLNTSVSLKNVKALIKVNNRRLIFFLTNSNSHIRLEIPESDSLVIKKEGEVLIEVKTFHSLINSLDLSKDLEIYHADKNYLQFFSGEFECDLVLIDSNEIQDVDIDKELTQNPIRISYETLRSAYTQLKDFCKNFENVIVTNTVLTNIHFKKKINMPFMEAWASDSYRTVYGEFEANENVEFEINIVPGILSLILNLYAQYSKSFIDFYLVNSGEHLICKKDGYTMKTRLNTSPYPSFIQWFNIPHNVSFDVNKNDLLYAIDRNLLLSERNIKTSLYRVEKNRLFIEYKDSERGKCKEILEIKNKGNGKIEFCLNNYLLRSLIKSINSDAISFNICDSLKPIVLLANSDTKFKQFILPARNI